jgi:hypothetical protein
MVRKYNSLKVSDSAHGIAPRTALRLEGAMFARVIFKCAFLFTFLVSAAANATLWYVDNTASGANNGTSWANAWTSLSGISGVKAGDTVYISGGPSGSSQSYTIANWSPTGGSSSSPITYQIGQDSLHNGTAIFNSSSSGASLLNSGLANVAIVGDAGDGNMHFSATGFSAIGSGANDSNVRIAFINFGQINNGIDFYPNATQIEIDHNYAYINLVNADHFSYAHFVGSAWNVNKAHNNTIYLPHMTGNAGEGADGFQWNGDAYSIYSNTIVGYNMNNYSGGQHQDGWQPTGGGSGTATAGSSYSSDAIYIKVYANLFMNLGNSACFPGVTYGGYNHLWIYNNIIMFDGTSVSGSPEGISAINNQPGTADYLDTVVANNLVVDLNDAVSSEWAVWVGVYDGPGEVVNGGGVVANNIAINANNINVSSGFTTGDNLQFTSASAVNDFVKYVLNNGVQNNFHLTSSATSLVGQGMNLSQYFNTDFAGNPRPATGNWDIGPYVYGSSATPTLSVSPISANASDVDPNTAGLQVYEGTTVQFSSSVAYNGSSAVNWQWTYSVNGGATVVYQSGSGSVPGVSFPFGTGTGGNTYVWTLSVTAGTNSASASLTMSVETPPAPNSSLTFQATSGVLTAPMTATGNYISQSVQSTVISATGEAAYTFTITNAGNYVVQAMVNAPNDAANSFYVNIDAQPVDPTMCWDIEPLTTNFQSRIVSWRGNGSDTNNQFNPQVFNLATGTHQIIIAGREANTELQSFSLLELPATPQNLRVMTTVSNAPTFSASP